MTATAYSIATLEVFDRNRLFVDLDEATDPESEPTVLLVIGLRQLGDGSDETLAELRDAFAELVGSAGSDYRTRATELCAILERTGDVDRIVRGIEERVAAYGDEGFRVAFGAVELPAEAHDAVDAVALVDQRVTAA